ncbi:cupin domain-containing protein [Succinimonas sp.]|uniref:cupin domain-containing protein n=1 Tax=Succinimonas sp. TaxID=1936151 RepID=UPI0038687BE8
MSDDSNKHNKAVMTDLNPADYRDGRDFHASGARIAPEERAPGDRYFKSSPDMARVVYRNAHENTAFPETDPRHGQGLNFCKWITSEQTGTQEHFSFNGNLNGILESFLEPGASVGWHRHDDTEEYYYVLEGSLYAECQDASGAVFRRDLKAGDLHRVSRGMSHYARAGERGARFLAIIVKAE